MTKRARRSRRRHRDPKNFVRFGDLYVSIREEPGIRRRRREPFELVVTYQGFSRDVDRQLFKIVGRWSDGSGCFIAGSNGGLRDHSWSFSNRAKAVGAYRRLLRASPLQAGDVRVKLRATLSGPYPTNFAGFVIERPRRRKGR